MPLPTTDTAETGARQRDDPAANPDGPEGAARAGRRRDVASALDIEHTAQAERTVTALQEGLAHGVPLMIPGGLGARRPTPAPLAFTQLAVVSDRRREEHEWEGGGAPDARGAPLPATASWRRRLYRKLGL